MAVATVTAKSTATMTTASATAIATTTAAVTEPKKLHWPYLVQAQAANHQPTSSATVVLTRDGQQACTGGT